LIPVLNGTPDDWRFEYKYWLTYPQYYQVRSAILPYMKPDRFSLAAPEGKYLVRSLYFDTADFRNYEEKINGDSDRVKLRIRTYSKTPLVNGRLRAELKARKGMVMEKHAAWIGFDAYETFMSRRHWPETSDPVLAEFERYVHLKAQRPKIIIEYLRDGFFARSGDDVRLTFDHKVTSACASTLFPERPFFRKLYPGIVIFEIKCDKRQPNWLRELVQDQGLRIYANSKYARGVEVARPDAITPAWSY
jgi:hypothetical protein